MNPAPKPKSAPWWQTIAASSINLVLTILAQHYLGNGAAGAVLASGTAVAHAMTSPKDQ